MCVNTTFRTAPSPRCPDVTPRGVPLPSPIPAAQGLFSLHHHSFVLESPVNTTVHHVTVGVSDMHPVCVWSTLRAFLLPCAPPRHGRATGCPRGRCRETFSSWGLCEWSRREHPSSPAPACAGAAPWRCAGRSPVSRGCPLYPRGPPLCLPSSSP